MANPALQRSRFLAPGDKLGKHDLIRQIAVGGMAELYLARTMGIEGFEKLVVVKRILPQYANNASFVNMFLNEARLAATLHHPNIAQVYDIGQEAGEYFFSMEYVHGEDLGRLARSALDGGIPISLDAALTLIAGLCAGLHHAHEKQGPDGRPLNVVHRDVSPSNVLVSYDGAVKLVDFGIARVASTPGSTAGGLKGKISYMSPEQCRGKTALDRRSDIFSVGTILYELTTGQLPFTDETEYAILNHIVNTDAAPPSTLVKDYPPALEAIVMRAMSRDPDKRYATALELQGALEDFAHDNRLRVSPLVLARLMSTLFPQRLEEWANARAQGAFFVEQYVVRTLIENATDGLVLSDADLAEPAAPPPVQTAVAGEVRRDEPEDESTAVSTPPITPEEDVTELRAPLPGLPPQAVPIHAPPKTPRPATPPIHKPSPTPPPRASSPVIARTPTPAPRASSPVIARAPTPPPVARPSQPITPVTQVGVAPPPAVTPVEPPQRMTPPPGVPAMTLQPSQPGTLVSSSSPSSSQEVPVVPVPRSGDVTERVRIADVVAMRKRRSKLPLVLALFGALGAAAVTYFVLSRDDGALQGTAEPSKPAAKPPVVEEPKPDPKPEQPAPEPVVEEAKAPPSPPPVDVKAPPPDELKKPRKPPPKVTVKKPPPKVTKKPPAKEVAKPEPKPEPAKETQWKNGDSPFMPVRTDKR